MALQPKKMTKVKLVILGGQGVGKTALAVRYITKRFIGEYDSNKDMLYTYKTVFEGSELAVDLLDTANDVTDEQLETHLKWADGVVLLYSIADRASLDKIHYYHSFITRLRHNDEDVTLPLIIAGNKIDLSLARKVSTSEGKSLAGKCDAWWAEISVAESKDGVLGIFEELLKQIKREHNKNRSAFPNMKKVFKKKVARSRSDSFFK